MQAQIGERRRNRRTGEVREYNGQGWVAVNDNQGVVTRQADPRLPAQVRQAENQAAASVYDPARAQADLTQTREQTENLRVQGDIARQNLERARIEAQRANRDDRSLITNLGLLEDQLRGIESIYNDNFRGVGIGSLMEYLPTPAANRFNSIANEMRATLKPLIRGPGEGTFTDSDQALLDSLIPSSWNQDATNEQVMENIRNRIEARRREVGLSPVNWSSEPQNMPGADRSNRPVANPSTQAPRELSGGEVRLQEDPVLRGVAGRLGEMVASGQSDQAIQSYLREAGVNPADTNINAILQYRRSPDFQQWRQRNPGRPYPIDDSFWTSEVPQTGTQALFSGAANSAPGAALANFGDATVAPALNLANPNAEQYRAGIGALREEYPMSSLAGTVGGTVAAYGGGNAALARAPSAVASLLARHPQWAARAGDAAYGGYQALGSGNVSDVATNVGGGMFGRGASRVIGGAARGVTDPTIRFLNERNIPLTLGQIVGQGGRMGQAVRGVEERLSGVPGAGAMVQGQYRRGQEGFNRAAFNEAVEPVGGNTGNLLGEQALDAARSIRSQAYDDTLNGVNLQVDPQLTTDLTAARMAGRQVPMSNPQQFDFTMSQNVDPFIASPSGFTGQNYQTAIQGLRRARTQGQRELNGYEYGQALTSVEDALEGAVGRQAPDVIPGLQAANETNRRVSTLQEALGVGMNQVDNGNAIFTPAQLGRSARANARRYGGPAAATSERRPFFELQRAAQEVLPNTVGDSGTAGRLLVPLAAGGLLSGAGAGSDALGITDNGAAMGLGAAGLLSAPYTTAGQRALQAMLLRRPEPMRRIGDYLVNDPLPHRMGGMFGVSTVPYYTSEQY